MKKIIWIVIVLVALISILATSSHKSTKNDIIKLGVISPTSGPASSIGEEVKNSIQLASSTLVSLMFEDDECDTKKAVSVYMKLKAEGVRIFYVSCSGSVMALAPLAKEDNNLILTAYAGSSEIRQTGDEVIRLTPDSISIADAMASYVISLATSSKIGLLYEYQDYAKSVAMTIKDKLSSRIVIEEQYVATDNTFRTQITKLKGKGIDTLIYIPTSDKAAKLVYKEMQTLSYNPYIIGDVNVCEYPFTPKDSGLKATCFDFGFSTETQAYKDFLVYYKANYGKDSNYSFNNALTYDTLYLINTFAKKSLAGDLVMNMKKFFLDGVEGKMASYKFTSDGEVISNGNLKQVDR